MLALIFIHPTLDIDIMLKFAHTARKMSTGGYV